VRREVPVPVEGGLTTLPHRHVLTSIMRYRRGNLLTYCCRNFVAAIVVSVPRPEYPAMRDHSRRAWPRKIGHEQTNNCAGDALRLVRLVMPIK
jgi:hypothetical protein